MKTFCICILLVVLSSASRGQSGTPSPAGQAITPQGEAAASAAVKGRHDKVVARKAAKAARKASAASS
jgi:hypothetical protein